MSHGVYVCKAVKIQTTSRSRQLLFFGGGGGGELKKSESSVVDDRVGKQMVSFSLILTCVNRVCTDVPFKGLYL